MCKSTCMDAMLQRCCLSTARVFPCWLAGNSQLEILLAALIWSSLRCLQRGKEGPQEGSAMFRSPLNTAYRRIQCNSTPLVILTSQEMRNEVPMMLMMLLVAEKNSLRGLNSVCGSQTNASRSREAFLQNQLPDKPRREWLHTVSSVPSARHASAPDHDGQAGYVRLAVDPSSLETCRAPPRPCSHFYGGNLQTPLKQSS